MNLPTFITNLILIRRKNAFQKTGYFLKKIFITSKRKFKESPWFIIIVISIFILNISLFIRFLPHSSRKPILKLQSTSIKSTYLYQSNNQGFKVYLGDKANKQNPQVKFETGDSSIDFQLADFKASKQTRISKTDSKTVTYKNIYPDIDLIYTLIEKGVKEEIIVNNQQAIINNPQFTFKLNLKNALPQKDLMGNFTSTFVDPVSGNYLFHFEPPFMVDAGGSKSYQVKMSIVSDDKQNYGLQLEPDQGWLTSALFPVAIDPTVVHDEESDFSAGQLNRVKDRGTITYSGEYTIHTFTSSGTFLPSGTGNVEVLVVAGGGGGGSSIYGWGGGGGGGIIYNASMAVSGSTNVTVGGGGASGVAGQDSYFGAMRAFGGGPPGATPTGDGGSGGGGTHSGYSGQYGLTVQTSNNGGTGYGNNGGANLYSSPYWCGSGGGAGAAGTTSGAGGAGMAFSISGTSVYYAGGGGQCNNSGTTTSGGVGGGGAGVNGSVGIAGTPNTGGGGGGSKSSAGGGAGGSGIVIVKYPTSYSNISPLIELYEQELTADLNTVGLWHLDEESGSGAYLKDSSGNNNDGTPTGTTFTQGKIGGGRYFNGSSDRIAQTTGSNVNVTGDISLEMWINPASFAVAQTPIHKDSQYSFRIDTSGYVAWADSSNFSYANFGYPNIGLTTNKWQHLAFTKTGGVVKIYLDGVEKYSRSFGGTITSTANIIHIGCYSNATTCTGSYFNGRLDEVRISNVARTPEEIRQNAQKRPYGVYTSPSIDFVTPVGSLDSLEWSETIPSSTSPSGGATTDIEFQTRTSANNSTWEEWKPTGISSTAIDSMDSLSGWSLSNYSNLPISTASENTIKIEGSGSIKTTVGAPLVDVNTTALWHFDETGVGTGSTAYDSTNNNNHGIATGTSLVNGFYGKARSFNGSSDYILLPPSSAFDLQRFTIEAWVNPTTTAQSGFIFEKTTNGSVNTQYSCFFNSDGTFYFRTYNSSATVDDLTFTSSSYFKVNQWNHLACVYDGSTKAVYVNGVMAASKSYSQIIQTNPAGTSIIGAYGSGTSYFFNGKIDEVKISSVRRTAEEISETYNAGKNRYLQKTISSTDLSSKNRIPFYVAADRPGTYMEAYMADSDTLATGGTVTDMADGSRLHVFTSNGTFTPNAPLNVEVLVIAGGGGGASSGSGGGAGGYVYNSSFAVTSGGSISVTVGNGGNGGTAGSFGIKGGDSIFSTITAEGGGIGVGWGNGGNGGSGGGGPITNTAPVLIGGNGSQGYKGGNGHIDSRWNGNSAGGGGAGAVGSNGCNSGSPCGNGGAGLPNSISGSSVYYAGGGAGADANSGRSAVGGIGGGGNSNLNAAGSSGTANTGGGGGGGAYQSGATYNGGSGGSGIVIVRSRPTSYPITIDYVTTSGSDGPTSTSDYEFTPDSVSGLYVNDTVIVREKVGETTYIAQGEVTNISSGTVTVASWSGTAPPSVGFSTNADVFKWQREYWDITDISTASRDSITKLGIRVLDGSEGFDAYFDDFRDNQSYLTDPDGGESITSTPQRYFQYRAILTSNNTSVTPSLTSVTLNYTINGPPSAPDSLLTEEQTNPLGVDDITPEFSAVYNDLNVGDTANKYQIQVATDLDFIGGNPIVPLDDADTVANWTSSDDTYFTKSQDTSDKEEGTGSVKVTAVEPDADADDYEFDDHYVKVFTSTPGGGTWTVPVGVEDVDILVVAGGGGGAQASFRGAAGGGAGGLVYETNYEVDGGEEISVTIGNGGAGAASGDGAGSNGNNSVFGTLTALAGGGGTTLSAGNDGGSGGGGGGEGSGLSWPGGTGTQPASEDGGFGYNGGTGHGNSDIGSRAGGGGGGAGAVGGNASSGNAAPGGAGKDYSAVFGTDYGESGWFAGGGAGVSVANNQDVGGNGGGGNSGQSGTANTGGGGGATDGGVGGAGGSGIVLVRWQKATFSNETLTRDLGAGNEKDLSGSASIKFSIKSSRTGTYLQFGFGETAWDDNTSNITINTADEWEEKSIDISGITNVDKNAVRYLGFKTTNIDDDFIMKFDDIKALPQEGTNSIVWDSGESGTAMSDCDQGERCSDISYDGTGLASAVTYYWRIKYWDDEPSEGDWSTETAYFTINSAPSEPTSLQVEVQTNPTGVTDTTPEFSAVYNDLDVGDTANKYRIQVDDDSAFGSALWDSGSSGTAMSNCDQGDRCSEISYGGATTDLQWGAKYYWRIKYWDDGGWEGDWSTETAHFTMLPIYEPTSCMIDDSNHPEQTIFKWADNTNLETGYRVERSVDDSSWTLLSTETINTTSKIDSTTEADATYKYRVRADSDNGNSMWCQTETVNYGKGTFYFQ